jgi:thiol-disulfide isomerase/thioredoxin
MGQESVEIRRESGKEPELMEFYGNECPHCIEMVPLVEKLEKVEGVKVQKFETWHDEENAKKFQEMDQGKCGGVPFFINTKTGNWICGSTDYETLRKWALEK